MDPNEVLARLAERGTPPDPASALRLSVGLDRTIERFQNETLPFVASGGAELQFAFAPYGRGKTHLLQTLQEVARQQGLATAYVDCRAANAPFASLQETYRIVANNLRPCSVNPDGSNSTGPDALIKESLLAASPEKARQLEEALIRNSHLAADYRNLVSAYYRAASPGSSMGVLLPDLRALLRADQGTRVRMSDLYKSAPSLSRPIGKLGLRSAASWVRSLASLPIALGYKGLAILFDETERSPGADKHNSKQRQTYLANLRNFVDHMAVGNLRGCVIYYAVVEQFLEEARRELEALSQRIERISLGGGEPFPNPRAVWVDLDELTTPSPPNEMFFNLLGAKITGIGFEAGLPRALEPSITALLRKQSVASAGSINSGIVREYVKFAANLVALEVSKHA